MLGGVGGGHTLMVIKMDLIDRSGQVGDAQVHGHLAQEASDPYRIEMISVVHRPLKIGVARPLGRQPSPDHRALHGHGGQQIGLRAPIRRAAMLGL